MERRLRRTLDILLDSDEEPAALLAELKSLEGRKADLTATLAQPTEATPLLHPNLAEIYRRKVAALHQALDHDTTRSEAMEVIRSLIQEVRLIPEDGRLRMELVGELAGILALCEAGKAKPGSISRAGLAEQIKVVAGARSQFCRTPRRTRLRAN